MSAMAPTMLLDNCAVKLDGPRAAAHTVTFDVEFTDRNETHRVVVASGVLRHRPAPDAGATTVSTSARRFVDLTSELATIEDALADATLQISGPAEPFATFVSLLDQFDVFFAIIEP